MWCNQAGNATRFSEIHYSHFPRIGVENERNGIISQCKAFPVINTAQEISVRTNPSCTPSLPYLVRMLLPHAQLPCIPRPIDLHHSAACRLLHDYLNPLNALGRRQAILLLHKASRHQSTPEPCCSCCCCDIIIPQAPPAPSQCSSCCCS